MPERPGPNDLLPHGTPAARQRHLAHGEELCDRCRVLDAALGYVPRHGRGDDRREVAGGG